MWCCTCTSAQQMKSLSCWLADTIAAAQGLHREATQQLQEATTKLREVQPQAERVPQLSQQVEDLQEQLRERETVLHSLQVSLTLHAAHFSRSYTQIVQVVASSASASACLSGASSHSSCVTLVHVLAIAGLELSCSRESSQSGPSQVPCQKRVVGRSSTISCS